MSQLSRRRDSAVFLQDYFAAPSYQTADVQGYLSKLGGKYSGKFNLGGRGFPDVSAQGCVSPISLTALL